MRTLRWLSILAALSLAAGCDGLYSACVFNDGHGPCEEDVPQRSCEGAGGVYHGSTTCADLGMTVERSSTE